MRNTIGIIVDTKRKAFHFTSEPLSGLHGGGLDIQGIDLWFPLDGDTLSALFESVERAMVLNKVAHNVTSVDLQRQCGASLDFTVTYNEVLTEDKKQAILGQALRSQIEGH